MGHWQWNSPSIFCVNMLVRPTHISPRQSGAARPCSTPPGGARQDMTVGYVVLQSVAPAGSSPWVYRGIIIAYTVHWVLV